MLFRSGPCARRPRYRAATQAAPGRHGVCQEAHSGPGNANSRAAGAARADDDSPQAGWARRAAPTYLNLRKASIYGGSNEVQRNIVALAFDKDTELLSSRDVLTYKQMERVIVQTFSGNDRVLSNDTVIVSIINLGGGDVVWNRRGVRLPAEQRATQVFKRLFLKGTPEEEAREMRRIQEGQSILDDVRGQVQSMNARLNAADRRKLEHYLSSVREAELRLQQDEKWSSTPKPKIDYPTPTNDLGGAQLVARSRQWFDIVRLALQTDSTRVITLFLSSQDQSGVDGVTLAHHDASHHGQEPTKLEQLALIEEAEIKVLGEFLTKIKDSQEGDHNLLDRTMVFYTSNLGNSSSHDNTNLPILIAGGGFKHQGHLAFDRKNNVLLSNLFLRMLRQMGIETNSFGASTGVLSDI